VNQDTLSAVRTVEQSVHQLVRACHKQGPVYARSPKAVAQVNRTSKWLLNALDRLKEDQGTPAS
jgi:hypothetical protein